MTDPVIVQSGVGVQGPSGPQGTAGATGAGYITTKVHVSSAQILALKDTAVPIVAAQTGKILVPLFVVYNNGAGNAYTADASAGLFWGDNTGENADAAAATPFAAPGQAVIAGAKFQYAATSGLTEALIGKALVLASANSNPTGGTFALDLTVAYLVITP